MHSDCWPPHFLDPMVREEGAVVDWKGGAAGGLLRSTGQRPVCGAPAHGPSGRPHGETLLGKEGIV